MKILKCLIVDDEPPAIRLLEKYVSKVPFLELIGTTTSSLGACYN
jgi:response regulator of citrate/malate metabolism